MASVEHPGQRRALPDPRAVVHARHAVVDEFSAAVIEEAATTLALLRSPMMLGDGLADLHAVVSLHAQIHAWLPTMVARARDQDHTWADIAGQLGVTADTARRRYRPQHPTTMDTR